jgi:hypothetical protein
VLVNNDLEQDMKNSKMILAKVQIERYAQNLYAAMCNMQWQKTEAWPVLKDELWSCTWRSSGGIVAELRGEGDYLSWYCSGIMDPEEHIKTGFVSEGQVTEEIKADLATLGWHPVPWTDNDLS